MQLWDDAMVPNSFYLLIGIRGYQNKIIIYISFYLNFWG